MRRLELWLAAVLALLLAIGIALLAAGGAQAAEADSAARDALRQRIELLRVRGDPRIGAGSSAARAIVAALYEQRGFAPLWSNPARAQSLRSTLEASVAHGLDPRDYHAGLLAAASVDAAERELLHTDALMRLAFHLYFGKADPRTLQQGWNFARTLDGVDPVAGLAQLAEAPDPAAALESLAPRLPQYRDLQRALASLRAQQQRGGWPQVGNGPALEPGVVSARVAELRARLQASGDLSTTDPAADPQSYDEALQSAVRRFQARHALEADGVVGRATLAALNVPLAARIEQLRVNLERLRWVARELAGDYLLVDIAGFRAQLFVGGTPAWSARVVVGKRYRTTPEFRARMKYLVLNPEWSVPPTILREDLLPKLLRDPNHLGRNAMRLLDRGGAEIDPGAVDWERWRAQPRAFPYQVVQAPGRGNPLGGIKFMFPNEHSVYLHDTAEPRLFDRPVRAFSSGCIRIELPLALARLLLDDADRWSEEKLAAAIAGGRTQTVPVRRAVPVLLLYFTATADADGMPQFRADLYGRDRPIGTALAAPFRFAPVEAGRGRPTARY